MPNKVTHDAAFPASLDVPLTTAASILFGDELSARDQSILLCVAWFASKHGFRDDGTVDVPDLNLRKALGNLRAPDLDRREARFTRLVNAVVTTDERLPDIDVDGVEAPILEPGIRRMKINGAHRWIVDEALVEALKPSPGEPSIAVPMSLLAAARCRYTLLLFLRIQSWRQGDLEPDWIRRQNESGIVLRLRPDELMAAVGYTSSPKPAKFEVTALEPALREIGLHSRVAFEYEVVRAPSIKRLNGGMVRGYDLMIGDTKLDKKTYKRTPEHVTKRSAPFFDSVRRKAAAKVVPISKPFEGKDDVDKSIEF